MLDKKNLPRSYYHSQIENETKHSNFFFETNGKQIGVTRPITNSKPSFKLIESNCTFILYKCYLSTYSPPKITERTILQHAKCFYTNSDVT